MRKIVFLFIAAFSALSLFAENVNHASNARAAQVERTMVITYDLSKTSNVRLLMSTNMSSDFKELKQVTGDVGKSVPAGSNRTITWHVLEEFDRFSADGVRFKVETYGGNREAVDLGLSVKWATCNVGANKPEDYGDYFAWGETQPKDYYDWSTYKYCNGSYSTLTKYNNNSSYGTVDNKTTLDLSDDAARANWGGSWRMPTKAEQDELRTKCTWTWTTQNGVKGYKVTSKSNGNSIFLPAAGFRYDSSLDNAGSLGCYWSSSLDAVYRNYAWSVHFYSGYVGRYYDGRYYGFSVRPVCQ